MLHLTGRGDLIHTILELVKPRAAIRAFSTGTVEVLGRFDPISPGFSCGGWAIRVTSIHGTVWYFHLIPGLLTFYVQIRREVFWENWAGSPSVKPGTLTSGDNPQEYGRLRDAVLTTI